MFGMGGSEIIVILIVALLFLGPDKLPQAAKSLSKGIRDIKKQSRALQQQIESDEQIGGAIRDIKSALRGDEPPPRPKPIKAKKPKPELAAGDGQPEVHAHDGAEPVETKLDAELPLTLPEPTEAAVEATSDEPAKPALTLPRLAGEPDADAAPPSDDDDDELAAMVKPAAGTVAKGSEPKHG
ncbi:MAG TPA: twin-arginine translocase TatA/TatE family subunit [Kofleriaceae bacterium]|nr:twin-arginine translocase TatA/TatE family subunit [Kofleriaceae bacterium]